MSQWGRIKLNMDAGNQFTAAESDVEAAETDGVLRTFLGMTVGGVIDLSFIKASVLDLKRLVIDAGNAATWDLQLEVTTAAGTSVRTLASETDFTVPNAAVWHPPTPILVDQSNGDRLILVTTGATNAMTADFLLSSW